MRNTLSVFLITAISFITLAWAVPTQAQFTDSPSQSRPAQTKTTRSNPFEDFISIVNFIFAIAFLFSLMGIIIATIKFIIAGGNEQVIGGANSLWVASLVGLGIALAGYVLINVIRYYLR